MALRWIPAAAEQGREWSGTGNAPAGTGKRQGTAPSFLSRRRLDPDPVTVNKPSGKADLPAGRLIGCFVSIRFPIIWTLLGKTDHCRHVRGDAKTPCMYSYNDGLFLFVNTAVAAPGGTGSGIAVIAA